MEKLEKADIEVEPTSKETLEEFQDSLKEIRLAQRKKIKECTNSAVTISGKRSSNPMSLDSRYTEDEVVKMVYECWGLQTQLCMKLDCSVMQFYKWLEKHPQVKYDMVKAREGIVNLAEEVIIKSLCSSDEKVRLEAAKTTLRQLGRNYGWGEANQPALKVDIFDGGSASKDKRVEVRAVFGLPDDGTSLLEGDAEVK